MRIGITMLSHDFRLGGPGTYTVEVVSRLLALDRANEYVLMYPAFGWATQGFGQYRQHPHVTEVIARVAGADQGALGAAGGAPRGGAARRGRPVRSAQRDPDPRPLQEGHGDARRGAAHQPRLGHPAAGHPLALQPAVRAPGGRPDPHRLGYHERRTRPGARDRPVTRTPGLPGREPAFPGGARRGNPRGVPPQVPAGSPTCCSWASSFPRRTRPPSSGRSHGSRTGSPIGSWSSEASVGSSRKTWRSSSELGIGDRLDAGGSHPAG